MVKHSFKTELSNSLVKRRDRTNEEKMEKKRSGQEETFIYYGMEGKNKIIIIIKRISYCYIHRNFILVKPCPHTNVVVCRYLEFGDINQQFNYYYAVTQCTLLSLFIRRRNFSFMLIEV